MRSLAIIGCAVGGAVVGTVTGFCVGMREGGDFNFAPLLYAPVGGLIGGFAGVCLGATRFA